jgi:hypothetical protein
MKGEPSIFKHQTRTRVSCLRVVFGYAPQKLNWLARTDVTPHTPVTPPTSIVLLIVPLIVVAAYRIAPVYLLHVSHFIMTEVAMHNPEVIQTEADGMEVRLKLARSATTGFSST